MFGEELYRLFVQVKKAFDPQNVLNPGIKLSETPFTEHIDYTRLSKSCATCAKCNSVCPVYDVFQSEDMSSRGWFEIVTAKDYSYLNSKRVVEACLNCKSCRTICPAGVDVSDLILQKRAEHPNRLAGWIFRRQVQGGAFESLLRFLGRTQKTWDRPFFRKLLERITTPMMKALAPTARLPHDLRLPKLAPRHLRERYAHLIPDETGFTPARSVAYFHGCAANYFDDGVGDAVIEVLKKHGAEPALPPQRCSGTPIQTYGHADLAREGARFNLRSFASYETIVTGCASCTLMLKDYPTLFPEGTERRQAEELAKKVVHISEFVARSTRHPATAKSDGATKRVTYHSSCHLRAAGVTKEPRQILSSLPGVDFVEMQDADRCAGGAGTYVVKDYDTSQKIFARKARAIAHTDANVVATSCPACMIQLKNGLGDAVEVKHVAQLLQDAYRAADREKS
jgi:Fe-S oxidoreductase